MKTRKKDEENTKSKLSLQKKKKVGKKALQNILSMPQSSLNETCEFQVSNNRCKEQSTARCQMELDEPEAAASSVFESKIEDDVDSFKKCPTCELTLTTNAFQSHVISCLKERFQKKGSNEDELSQEKFVCQFCTKDLSHYNSTRKTQHLNRCLDKVDEMKQKETEKTDQLEKAKTAVLDCPMCGKALKTESGRKIHMKKCSQKLGVSTDQLLTLIKQQEEERQVDIAAGLVPLAARSTISKLNKQTKKKLKEPQSKYEEELQTALAISDSLSNKIVSKKTESQLQKQGRKKKTEPTPSLVVLLSEEEKQKRRSERVATMLIPQDLDDDDNKMENLTPVFCGSLIQEKYSSGNDKMPSLWSRCELSTENLTTFENKDKFYVDKLMPPICVSRFVVGSNIKKVESIPGRRQSTYKGIAESTEVGSSTFHADTMLASTQTAVILAELEVNAGSSGDLDLTCSGFCPDSPVKVQEKTKQKVSDAHQKTMVSMVNNPNFSDIRIQTSDGIIHGHRLILGVQCPKILQDCHDEVGLTNYSSTSVLAVMKYLYAGAICLPKGSVSEIKDLASWLEIDDLVEICSSALNDQKMADNQEPAEDEEEERNFSNLQNMMTEDNEEGNPSENEECEEENNSRDGISNEDYNDIMCTQRKKYSVTEGRQNQEDSGKESSEVDQSGVESDVSEGEISLFFHDESFDGTAAEQYQEDDECDMLNSAKKRRGEEKLKGDKMDEMDIKFIDQERGFGDRTKETEIMESKNEKDSSGDQEGRVNKELATEEVNQKLQVNNSIVYQDEDLIIYSETEDTPPCSGSEVIRTSQSVDPQSVDLSLNLDRSGRAESPLIVASGSSSHSFQEGEGILVEEGDVGSGSPVIGTQGLDSSGLDLFESPMSIQTPDRINSQNRFPETDKLSPGLSPGKFSPPTPHSSHSPAQSKTGNQTPVKVSTSVGSKRILRRSNLNKVLCDSASPKQSSDISLTDVNDRYCVNVDDGFNSPTSVTSIHSDSEEDEVSLIQDKSQVVSSRHTVGSPVCQQQPSAKKSFRFTKTKPVVVNLERYLTPEKEEQPDVVICDEVNSSPGVDSSKQNGMENEADLDNPIQDVWEGFNDSGMDGGILACDLPSPTKSASDLNAKSPTPKKIPKLLTEPDTPTNASRGSKGKVSKNHSLEVPDELGESFGNDSFDVEMAAQVTENQNFFKTPTENRRPKKTPRDWVPPSPFTPMPSYDTMNTPQLKKEVQKIGVKPVGKKRMLLLLKDVYKQTHQYETDSEFETSVDEMRTEQNLVNEPVSVSGDEEDEISSSQESEMSVILEESMADVEEEITPSQAGSDVLELTQKISQFIQDNPDMYTKILMYEPIELDGLKREITEAGIKCSMEKLMNYLDEKCITFTMKNRRKASPKKGRGRGRKKKAETESV